MTAPKMAPSIPYRVMKVSLEMKVRGALVLGVCLLTSGCATIIHGTDQDVRVSSNPAAASVSVDGGNTYKTPFEVKLARKKDHILVFSKDGFEQQDVTLMHVVSGAVAGNIIAGGLIGWGVDAMSGGQYRLVPENVNITLKPLTLGFIPRPGNGTIQISVEERLKKMDELHDKKLVTETEYQAMRQVILQSAVEQPSSVLPR